MAISLDGKEKSVHNCINVFNNWASLVAQMVKNLHGMQETLVLSLGLEDSLEKGIAEFHGHRNLAGYIVHGVAKSQTRLSTHSHSFE